ncbi:hypothetical protein FB45DRAFT_1034471 [Roridomyces roridus]|uniref:Uncharacterized protein n=1 Tax=Roridomyces roridus TaxID=1738132 RepID=A0AAD7BCY3_9AGAR|nr:hypothetical protein FB45DRAFT_1034471 [Roridomyces roridus]
MPTGSQRDDSEGPMSYRSFLEYNSFGAVYSTFIWAMLILNARWKRGEPQQKRAGTHFLVLRIFIVYRILLGKIPAQLTRCSLIRSLTVMFLGVSKPSSEFTAMASHCLREAALLSGTCAPLGVTIVFPIAELFLAGAIAFLIRTRAIAKHGTAQVDTPPPPPKLVAAWKLGEIMELDDEQGDGSIGLKV